MKEKILERFLRYVKIATVSDIHSDETPSTDCQWNLLKMLEKELLELGLTDVELDSQGYLIARLEATTDKDVPVVGFMAHVDTSADVPGENVKPRLHQNYDGFPIVLEGGTVIDPSEDGDLGKYKGHTIITSDGTTLLGADDKAGIAEIMTAVEYFMQNPREPRGSIEIIFTPDEETGKGMNRFPREKLKSIFCYTLDGGEEGHLETECFNAYSVTLKFTGRVIHLGSARNKLVNAVTMASTFVSMLPQSESPEATDGRLGYYCPLEMKAELGSAEVVVFLRDFELPEIERRIESLKAMASAVEAMFPGGKIEVVPEKQYLNMREHMSKVPRGMSCLTSAAEAVGVMPEFELIRGGTDGARLAEMGIPAPNVFTGGHNFHSKKEWAVLSTMEKSALLIINLVKIWAQDDE